MAGSGGSGHGRERSNSGRKRKYEDQSDCGKNHKGIYLESRIFQSWLQAKFDAGYESCSDSDCSCLLQLRASVAVFLQLCLFLKFVILNNCFLFLQDCRPLHQSSLRFCSAFAIVTTEQIFPFVSDLHGHPRQLFCFRFVLHALLHYRNLIQLPK